MTTPCTSGRALRRGVPALFPALLALAGLAPGGVAQQLVADLNQVVNPYPVGADRCLPGPFSQVANGRVVFSGSTLKTGYAVWSTDGTAAGTQLVAECEPLYDVEESWASTGALAVFLARDSVNDPLDLWRTDGTAAGTWKLIDSSAPGSPSLYLPGSTMRLTAIGNLVFFNAVDPNFGDELWRTDGTLAGTFRLTDIEPGSAPSYAHGYAAVGSRLYFTAFHGSPERDLYVTDGTVLGTYLVHDVPSNNAIGSVWSGGETPPRCFFDLGFGASIRHLYVVDNLGVRRVEDGNGTPLSYVGSRAIAAPFGFYYLAVGSFSWELGRCDGTVAGTLGITATPINPPEFAVASDRLYFRGYDNNTSDHELYAVMHNGLVAYRVREIGPGWQTSRLTSLTMVGDTLAFMADDGVAGTELWRSDGTASGTLLVKDLMPGPTWSYAGIRPKCCHGRLFFMADDAGLTREEPFVSDLTFAGTNLIADLARQPNYGSFASPGSAKSTAVGNRVFFLADDGVAGRELCVSDGNSVQRLSDFEPGSAAATVEGMAAFGERLFLAATTPGFGSEPWISDGTVAGTQMLLDVQPGTGDSVDMAPGTAVLGGRLYFSAFRWANGYELWSTDGTAAGTAMVVDLVPGTGSSLPRAIVALGAKILFYAGGAWRRTDGTAAGTAVVATLPMPSPYSCAVWNGRVYFTSSSGGTGYELWATDGTAAGTVLVADIRPGSGSSTPSLLTAGADALWFVADDGSNGKELWSSDGTAAGTQRMTTFPNAEPYLSNFIASGEQLFFFAFQSGLGEEPWCCDRAAGARALGDLNPGSGSSIGQGEMVAAGTSGRVFFAAYDGTFTELWHSDGSAPGTAKFADLSGRLASTSPQDFVRAGHTIFFAANDVDHGAELWKLPFAAFAPTLAVVYGEGCPGTGGAIPRIGTVGQPKVTNANFGFRVDGALPNVFGLLTYGFGRGDYPFGGCTLLNWPIAVTNGVVTDALGSGVVPFAVNDPAMIGLNLFEQFLMADPQGSLLGLASATPGLEILLGN